MLPKNIRIHSRGGFTYIYSNGLRIKGIFGNFFAVTSREGGSGNFKFGFAVSKKIGGAVTRNLMRRRLTEIAYAWSQDNKDKEIPSFNSVYSAVKFADSFDDLKKEFYSQCDKAVSIMSSAKR